MRDVSENGGGHIGDGLAEFALCFKFPAQALGEFQPEKVGALTVPKISTEVNRYCLRLSKVLNPSSKAQASTPAGVAYKALRSMLTRLQRLVASQVIMAVASEPSSKWTLDDFVKCLPPSFHPSARGIHACSTLQEERKALETAEHEWDFLARKLSFFETISSSLEIGLLGEEFMKHFKEPCAAYVEAYIQACEMPLKEVGEGLSSELTKFWKTYGHVIDCAETWQMQQVSSFFDRDNEESMKAELGGIKSNLDQMQSFCESMGGVIGHSSGNEMLKSCIECCGKFAKEAASLMKDVKKACTTLVVAAEFLCDDPPTRKSVQHVLKFVGDEFGLSKEDLPSKLRKLVADALADNKVKKDKENKDESMPAAEPKKRAKAAKDSAPKKKPKK